MKWIEKYLEEEKKIKLLGQITYEEEYVMAGEPPLGIRLIVDHKDIDLVVWYVDYALWLEKQIININQII